jgi:hypothetical protein
MSRSSSISSRLFSGASSAEIEALKAKLELQATELATLKTSGVGINQDALSLSLEPLRTQITVADKSAKDALNGVDSVDDKVELLAGVVDTNSTNVTAKLTTLTNTINDAKAIAVANDGKISNLESQLEIDETRISDLDKSTFNQINEVSKKATTAEFNASEALKAAATAAVELSKIPGQLTDVIINNNEKISVVRGDLQNLSLAHGDLSTFVNKIDTTVKAIPAQKDYQPAIDLKADTTAMTTALALKADKTALATTDTTATALAVRVKAIEDVPTATTAEVIAKSTNVRKFTPNMVYNAAAAVLVDQRAITEWSATVTYGKGNIAMRNKSYFESNITGNLNKDPSTDATAAWSPFTPGETNSLFFNRSPTNSDVYPVGVKWYDLSFGSDTPLVSLSLGNGAWAYLNQVTLAKIRMYCSGRAATYRSSLNNVRFYKHDGTQISNGWFVWGGSSGIDGGGAGVAYNGQQIYCGYNASGWVDIEVSSQFDPSITIGKVMGNLAAGSYASCSQIQFWYTNGSKKVFTGPGYNSGDIAFCTCDPAVICKYGDAISAAQGVMLTGAQLSDPNDNTYGRISPAALNSAIQAIVSPTAKTPSQADFDLLLSRVAALEAKP